MNANKVFWAEFLDMYKSLTVLWKVDTENYCSRDEKAVAYDKLVDKLKEIDPEASKGKVTRKIHIFRTNYRRELRKIRKCKAEGADDAPTLWYFDLLHFLTDEEEQNNVKSTITDDDSVSYRNDEVFEPPVKRKKVKEDEILKLACEQLKESNDAVLEKVWVSQYADNMFWYEFLEMYKSLPVLWQAKSEKYCNRVETDAAYDKLVNKLKERDPEANKAKVIKKIHTFRSNYRRELKKLKGRVDESTLWYFDLLHSLTDQEEQSNAKSTMSDDESVASYTVLQSDRSKEVFEEDDMAYEKFKESNDATSVLPKGSASRNENKVFWSEFLDMYKSLPVLWKVNSESYCSRDEKAVAYEKLVDKLKEIDPEANKRKVIKKIHVFRTNYRRELRKIKKSKTCGAGADDVPTLWYFDLLHFLTDEEEQSKAKSTMSDNDSVSVRSIDVFEEDENLNITCEQLKESNDDISVLAEGWALQYAELENKQRVLARRIWADVLFHGCMHRLTEKMVEDIHHVLKGTSNTSTPTPTSPRSATPYSEEYSYSPQPQFTFVDYEQNDETVISPPSKSEPCDELGQNLSIDLPSRSIITNKEVIKKSSSTPTNLKEYIVSFANDNENENVLNNSDEIEDNIDEEEYEDMFEVDDEDMMETIDHEDDSHDEMNNKNFRQNPEKNRTPNAAKVAISILNRIREDKIKSDARRKQINWTKLDDDERRELKRLQRRRDCVCDQCGRHFTDPSNLKLHLLRHTGIKNYACKECDAKFYTAHLLRRHSLMHKSTPPRFPCKYCGKTFIYNNYRMSHERGHFKERRFHCDYCDKSFFKAYTKRQHELRHKDCREFHCELCDQHFFRETHLIAHCRSKSHKNKEQQMK